MFAVLRERDLVDRIDPWTVTLRRRARVKRDNARVDGHHNHETQVNTAPRAVYVYLEKKLERRPITVPEPLK